MPIVQINLLAGRTLDQKRALVRSVTDALVETIGTSGESVRIILNEMPFDLYAINGNLLDETG